MKKIDRILSDSQNILNNMKHNQKETISSIKDNHLKLEKTIMEYHGESIYNKYIDIHNIILESAQKFLDTNDESYKMQPLFDYLQRENFEIDNNQLKLSIKEKEIILNYHSRKIEINDEFHLENDSLFEKENIPLLIKKIASKKDYNKLDLLENYIKSLINQAEEEIE